MISVIFTQNVFKELTSYVISQRLDIEYKCAIN